MTVVLDYFLNKNITLENVSDEAFMTFQHGDKLLYSFEEKGVEKRSIGTFLTLPIQTDRVAFFKKKLNEEEIKEFTKQQQFALKIFPLFKKKFRSAFPGSKPITARYNHVMDQIYFYFYSEERYVFGDFVRELREELGKNIFLFQVGARDMIKLHPQSEIYLAGDDPGMAFAYLSSQPFLKVDVEKVVLQGLEGRDIDRLKGPCGKLKCSLLYEADLYEEEGKKFPIKGSKVNLPGAKTGVVLSFNIMTREVVTRTEEGDIFRIPLTSLNEINTIKKK